MPEVPWLRLERELRRFSPDHKAYLAFHKVLWQRMEHVSFGARAVYAYLLTFENWKTNIARPCQETMCHHLSMSERPLRNYLKELEKADLIRIKRIIWRGKKKNLYELYAPRPLSGGSVAAPSEKIVHFPIPVLTNSTQGTIPTNGSTDSTPSQIGKKA